MFFKQEGSSLNMVSTTCLDTSPSFSPSSDKRLWSNLRNRVDVLLEEKCKDHKPNASSLIAIESERTKRLKNDSLLLLKGFDSVSHTLSQLSSNLDNALQVKYSKHHYSDSENWDIVHWFDDNKKCFCKIRELEN